MTTRAQQCVVCEFPAKVRADGGFYVYVDCHCCREFKLGRAMADDIAQTKLPEEWRPLASYLIRRMQGAQRPILDEGFFSSLSQQALPGPAEMLDNLLLWIAGEIRRPGRTVSIDYNSPSLAASIGAVDGSK